MKIKKISQKDPTLRITYTLKQSTLKMLEAYQAYYEAAYKEPIEQRALVEEMLTAFASSDKDFVKFKEELEASVRKKETKSDQVQSLDAEL